MFVSKTLILGNLGRDPEMRYLPSGQAVTDMSVASNRKYTNKNNEKITETTWWRVSAWGSLAEICNQYLKKGSKVLIEARLVPDPETGGPRIFYRNDGSAGANYECVAMTVTFLDSAGDRQQRYIGEDEFDVPSMDDVDDIPF